MPLSLKSTAPAPLSIANTDAKVFRGLLTEKLMSQKTAEKFTGDGFSPRLGLISQPSSPKASAQTGGSHPQSKAQNGCPKKFLAQKNFSVNPSAGLAAFLITPTPWPC